VAVALAAFELTNQRPPREPWVEVLTLPIVGSALGGYPERGWLRIS